MNRQRTRLKAQGNRERLVHLDGTLRVARLRAEIDSAGTTEAARSSGPERSSGGASS